MREQLLDLTAMPFTRWQQSLVVRDADLATEQDREALAARQTMLKSALDGGADVVAAYLREHLEINDGVAIDAPPFPRERLTPSELREPPAELELEIADAWRTTFSPAFASRPLFWLLCHIEWLEQGRFGPDSMHAFFTDGARDTLDSRTRTFMRRSGGLPHIRGNVSVFSDCSLARAWWRVRIAAEAAADPDAGLTLADAHATLRSNGPAWERFALLGLRQVTVISQPRARAALIAVLTEQNVFDDPSVLRTGRALARAGTMRSLAHVSWPELHEIAMNAAADTGSPV